MWMATAMLILMTSKHCSLAWPGRDNGVQIGCTGADLNLDGSVDITDLADWKVLISLP
jgi:hypothetical protein